MERHVAVSAEYGWAAVRDAALLAEECGFDGYWVTDLRFAPDCFTMLGALAAITSRIRLVTGVSDPYSRHPAQLAASIAALEEIAPGRAVLGIGAGGSNLDRIGVTRSKPLATVGAAVSSVRNLLHGETVTTETTAFNMTGARLSHPHRAPIAVAAHGPLMYELAGRLSDVAIIANVVTDEGYAWARERIEKGARTRSADLAPVRYAWRVDVCLSAVPGRARELARDRVRAKLARDSLGGPYLASLGLGWLAASNDWSTEEVDTFIDATAFVGTPEEVGYRMADAAERFRPDLMCCRIDPAPGEDALDGIRLLDACLSVQPAAT